MPSGSTLSERCEAFLRGSCLVAQPVRMPMMLRPSRSAIVAAFWMTVVSAVSLGIVVLAFGWPKHDRPVDRCASTLRVDGYSHITDEYSRSFSSVKTYWIGPSSADPSRLVTQPGFDVRAVADGARLGALRDRRRRSSHRRRNRSRRGLPAARRISNRPSRLTE